LLVNSVCDNDSIHHARGHHLPTAENQQLPLVAGSGGSQRQRALLPGKLPALLDALLDGQDIDEPFELWS
jgi:hypothetical protein